jgi:signal transduction histidine kinase
MENKNKNIDNNDHLKFLTKEKMISDQIINNSRSMISIINRDYIYEKVNTAFANAHQAVLDVIVGKSLVDVWGKEVFQNTIKKNIDLCFSGKIVRYEACFDTPGQGKRYYDVVFRPLTIESDEITHLLVETFDIDDLKQSKLAVFEKEEELRRFETNLPIGFLRCDPEGKILISNKAFHKIMDCKNPFTNIKSFYQAEGLFEMQLDQLIKYQTKSFGRVSLKNCKGNEVPCRLSGNLTCDKSGNPAFVDFAFEDSTHELMLENRLLQAQKLETIGSLAGGIAHDFNNILATILGYSDILLDDLQDDPQFVKHINKIKGAVLKANSLTNQILTFSRQIEQEKIQVNIREVLNETIGFVKSVMPRNITVKCHFSKEEVKVFADPTQLFRVILNLMTNAIQAMEEKGGSISVSTSVVNGSQVQHDLNKAIVADEYVLLTFRDTGKGMDQTLMNRIFEPFFTTREVGKGTGLGLSVIHGIVTEMEGEIIMSSEPGKGSVFYIYLPVSKPYTNIALPEKDKKILFITGNRYESRILSLALESSGNELVYVSDRKDLLKIMTSETNRPDLIIYMSDSKQVQSDDIVSLYKSLKLKTPCILITEANSEILEEKLLNSGIIMQHLIKPVSLKDISNAIQISLK